MCRHSYGLSHEKWKKAPQNISGLGPLKAVIRPCGGSVIVNSHITWHTISILLSGISIVPDFSRLFINSFTDFPWTIKFSYVFRLFLTCRNAVNKKKHSGFIQQTTDSDHIKVLPSTYRSQTYHHSKEWHGKTNYPHKYRGRHYEFLNSVSLLRDH